MNYWELQQAIWSAFPWWAPILFVLVMAALLLAVSIRHTRGRR